MPDDLLANAQKQINEAAQAAEGTSSPAAPPPTQAPSPTQTPPPSPTIPPADTPAPPAPQDQPAPPLSPPDQPTKPPPAPAPLPDEPPPEPITPPTPPESSKTEETTDKLIDTLIAVAPPPPLPPAAPPAKPEGAPLPPPPRPKPKPGTKGVLLTILLLLFVTLPLTVFYVSQQQQLADLRGRAQGPYPSPTPRLCPYDCITDGEKDRCVEFFPNIASAFGYGDCGAAPPPSEWCCRTVSTTSTPKSTPKSTPIPTPTRQPITGKCSRDSVASCVGKDPGDSCGVGKVCKKSESNGSDGKPICKCLSEKPPVQCKNIKIYKNGQQVDPSSLQAGDQVVIAVAHENASKARIRVNGGNWTETTTKNAQGEYTKNFTIPSGVTTFTIEAEVYKDGVWK